MTKLKKRVARNKISRFVNRYPLILFFHTNDKNYFINQFRNIPVLNALDWKDLKPLALKTTLKNESFSIQSTRLSTPLRSTGFGVKSESEDFNNYTLSSRQKVGESRKASFSEFSHRKQSACKQGLPRLVKNNLAIKAIDLLFNRDKLHFLLNGPGFLLGVKKTSQLKSLVPLFEKNRNLSLIGGIYQNTVLDSIEIRRLADLVSEELVFLSLISAFQNSYQIFNKLKRVQLNFLLEKIKENKLRFARTGTEARNKSSK